LLPSALRSSGPQEQQNLQLLYCLLPKPAQCVLHAAAVEGVAWALQA
jgi:hypothetical protein